MASVMFSLAIVSFTRAIKISQGIAHEVYEIGIEMQKTFDDPITLDVIAEELDQMRKTLDSPHYRIIPMLYVVLGVMIVTYLATFDKMDEPPSPLQKYLEKEVEGEQEKADPKIKPSKPKSESNNLTEEIESSPALPVKVIKKEEEAFSEKRILAIHLENCAGSNKYFALTRTHASISFVVSIIACFAGLAAMGYAIWLVSAGKSDAALIPTISAAVAELTAATVFWVHRKSAAQLNRYYDSLHEIEVFLSALAVIKLVSSEKQDDAYDKILGELFEIQKIKAQNEAHAKKR